MVERSSKAVLCDITDAIDHIRAKLEGISLAEFQGDLDRRRIVERSFEIISEASRRLPDDLKWLHPEIPWQKVAGIGNILRHDYENVIPNALWNYAHTDLAPLEEACRAELKILKIKENGEKFEQAEQERQASADPGRDDRSI